MSERPILFSGPMVRAILEGRKTQTRRVVKPQPDEVCCATPIRPRPYETGMRLWVRETFSRHFSHGQHRDDGLRWEPWGGLPSKVSPDGREIVYYREGFDRCGHGTWRPSIYMPRWASRITLEITDVRCQRLQDISCADAIAEGVRPSANSQTIDCDTPDPRHEFRALWNSINAKRAPWESNPLVWAITFRRVVE